MIILQFALCVILSFFVPYVFMASIGLCFVRIRRLHRLGVRLLAMSRLFPSRCISCICRQNCESTNCGNWSCANYDHSKKC